MRVGGMQSSECVNEAAETQALPPRVSFPTVTNLGRIASMLVTAPQL